MNELIKASESLQTALRTKNFNKLSTVATSVINFMIDENVKKELDLFQTDGQRIWQEHPTLSNEDNKIEVSNYGEVKRNGRLLEAYRKSNKRNGESDYVKVVVNSKASGYPVHQLVLETFAADTRKPDHMIIRHLNDISDDNRLSNLKYGTHAENLRDARRNNRFKNWLQVEVVHEIWELIIAGKTNKQISEITNVNIEKINNIRRRKTYVADVEEYMQNKLGGNQK